MKTMAWLTPDTSPTENPSVGSAAQTSVLVVTFAGVVQVGGLPLAASPKAKVLRWLAASQPVVTPMASHAAGTPPLALLRPTVD